jgi:hypothetical protein
VGAGTLWTHQRSNGGFIGVRELFSTVEKKTDGPEITLHSVGDQKQIFGGIGQDHVQKLAINGY